MEALSLCLWCKISALLIEAERNNASAIIDMLQRYVDGYLNETVKQRNFYHRVQQQGETFDNFLISLRNLIKTCKFYSESCVEKIFCDQVIEGICDGDTVEELLQENNLMLATPVT